MFRESHRVPCVVGAVVGAPAAGTVCRLGAGQSEVETSTSLIEGAQKADQAQVDPRCWRAAVFDVPSFSIACHVIGCYEAYDSQPP